MCLIELLAYIEQVVTEFMEGVRRDPAEGTLCSLGVGIDDEHHEDFDVVHKRAMLSTF
jgi:hypothetical protein